MASAAIHNAALFVAIAGVTFSLTLIILCIASLCDHARRWFR